MIAPTRRRFLAGGALASATLTAAVVLAEERDQIDRDQRRYLDFGINRAGGEGDRRTGEWLEHELTAAGYAIARQTVSVPWFETERATLTVDGASATVLAQPIVVPTPPEGIAAPLMRVSGGGIIERPVAGGIALIDLPAMRWSSAVGKAVQAPVAAALAAGARAVVIVTNGPTGDAIALNADGRRPMADCPIAILAPRDAGPFFAAAASGRVARLVVAGRGGRRPATNFVARLNRGRGRWTIVSTPRSGWFRCAAERGSGVAAWLALARWAPAALPDHDLAFVCNTGHEYEYLGSETAIETAVPKPAETAAWLHLGANVAARDWHEYGPRLLPLTTPDPQRYLTVSPHLIEAARRAFAGQAGFASPYAVDAVAAGEVVPIVRAGYRNVAGTFGGHRYHHVDGDDERCLLPDATGAAVAGFRQLLQAMLAAA